MEVSLVGSGLDGGLTPAPVASRITWMAGLRPPRCVADHLDGGLTPASLRRGSPGWRAYARLVASRITWMAGLRPPRCVADRLPDAIGRHRHVEMPHPERSERVVDRVEQRRQRAHRAGLA